MKHFLLTIDVEDWFQVENLRPWFPMDTWSSQQVRVEHSTRNILDLLTDISSKRGKPVRATFFILAWIAKRMPSLVREIMSSGHEIASHGYNHRLCLDQSEKNLRNDLEKSKKLLEDISGHEVCGYRAPSFSISERILDIIRSAGHTYDASYNSFSLNTRYGRLSPEKYKRKGIALDIGNGFYELPLTNLNVLGKQLPFSGGGYFRLLPSAIFKIAVREIFKKEDAYHFYIHPWETDPGQPRQNQASMTSKFKHYINLNKTLPRLESLINSFSDCDFISCKEYLRFVTKKELHHRLVKSTSVKT